MEKANASHLNVFRSPSSLLVSAFFEAALASSALQPFDVRNKNAHSKEAAEILARRLILLGWNILTSDLRLSHIIFADWVNFCHKIDTAPLLD